MRLVLFDIDGTLLDVKGAGRTAFCQATRQLHGIEEDLSGVSITGNTDWQIAEEILAKRDLPAPKIAVNTLLDRYLACLEALLVSRPGHVLPGVLRLLERIGPFAVSVLLTGNAERAAFLKLAAHGLDGCFQVGAFGDDHRDRNALGEIARRRAERFYRATFRPRDIVLFGDTPRDIACGRALGATVVAVATGRHSADRLQQEHPDIVLENLSDSEKLSDLLARG